MLFPILSLSVLAGGAAAAAAYFVMRSGDGEPAPPIELPAHEGGGSGIAVDDKEVEAGSRILDSEAKNGTAAERTGIAWVMRNRFRGKSIYATEYPWRAQNGSNPPFSSARPTNDETRRFVREVLLADQSQDPTGGATSFFEPKMQDVFFKAGEMARAGETGDRVIDGVRVTDITRFKNYKYDADGIRKRWSRGSALYARAGRFEFWGSARAKHGDAVRDVVAGVPGRVGELEALGIG